jgi:hypothetical protein
MLFFWQVGLVDTFSLIQFCVNSGSQYGAIVVASAAGNFSDVRLSLIDQKLLDQNQEEVVMLRLGRQILRNDHGQQQRIVFKLVQLKVAMDFSVDFLLDRLRTHTIQGVQVDRNQ